MRCFLYTDVVTDPSDTLAHIQEWQLPLFCLLLNSELYACFYAVEVAEELLHQVARDGHESVIYTVFPKAGRGMKGLCSTSSITRLAITTETGDPMAVPWIC